MKTVYSARAWRAFETVFRPWMGRRLGGVRVRGLDGWEPAPGLPVLLVANHVSWWDGFFLREIHRALRPDAPFHVVMSELELRKHPTLRVLGAVPLSPRPLGARALVRDLEHRLARTPGAVIGYFPQGRIWPSHRRPLGFRRGVGWLAGRLAPATVLPVGVHLEPLAHPGPTAFIDVGPPRAVEGAVDCALLERAVEDRLDAILAFVALHGEDAPGAWRPDT